MQWLVRDEQNRDSEITVLPSPRSIDYATTGKLTTVVAACS
jgi:hypothetical protein